MPCYNAAAYIEESIRSVLLQGLPNLEFIVIDGGSTDGTVDIIKKYRPWIAYWVSEPDKGQSDAINKGLARCTGDFFNWHNADDVLLPGSLAETLQGFLRYPDALYICRHRLLGYPDGRIEAKARNPAPGEHTLRKALVSASPGGQPGGLMRMAPVRAAGGVNPEFVCCMDEELMMKLRLQGPGYYLNGPGIVFRVHPQQQSTLLLKERIAEKEKIITASFHALPPGHPLHALQMSARIFAMRHACKLCLAQKKRLQALIWHLRAQFTIWREQRAGRTVEGPDPA